jgi:hypothetical protein
MPARDRRTIIPWLIGVAVVAVVILGAVKLVKSFTTPSARTVRVAPASPVEATRAIAGTVRDVAGQPVAGAKIFISSKRGDFDAIRPPKPKDVLFTTAGDGKFAIAAPIGRFELIVHCDAGYAQVSDQALAHSTDVRITPWGRVEGRVIVGGKPVPNLAIRTFEGSQPPGYDTVTRQAQARTDAAGHFNFPRVPVGELWINYRDQPDHGRMVRNGYGVVEPGKTTIINVGDSGGRTVAGRFTNPPTTQFAWSQKSDPYNYDAWIRTVSSPDQALRHAPSETPEQWRAAEEAFGKTTAGARMKPLRYGWPFQIDPDGSFTLDDVPAGIYRFDVVVRESDDEIAFAYTIARADAALVVEPPPAGRVDEPQTLAPIALTLEKCLRTGDQATPFAFKTQGGKARNVTDYRGNNLLLVWWRTEPGFKQEIDRFKKTYARLKDNPRVQIVWLCFTDLAIVEKTARDFDIPGTIATCPLNEIPAEYQVCPVTATLIDPQGKVVKKFIMGEPGEKWLTKTLGTK